MNEAGPKKHESLVESRVESQGEYIGSVFQEDRIWDQLLHLSEQVGGMDEACLYTFAVPAYKEGADLYQMLERNYIGQKKKDGTPIDPKTYEVVIFVNCDQFSEIDQPTLLAAQKFRDDHPELNINVCFDKVTHPVNDEGKVKRKMGLIYKILADLVVGRNVSRAASEEVIANHVMRTGGADAEGKSDYYLDDVLQRFVDSPELVQYKSEARLPDVVREHIPSVDFVYLIEEAYNRLHHKSVVGLGSYRTALYCEAGGFNPDVAMAEEVKLSQEFKKIIAAKNYSTQKTAVHNAYDNPARFLFAYSKGLPMVDRYFWFNEPRLEQEFRKFNWQEYLKSVDAENLISFALTAERELAQQLLRYIRVELGTQQEYVSIPFSEQSEPLDDLLQHFYNKTGPLLNITDTIFTAINIVRDKEQLGAVSYNLLPSVETFLDNRFVYNDLFKYGEYFNQLCQQLSIDPLQFQSIAEFLTELKRAIFADESNTNWEVSLKWVLDFYVSRLHCELLFDGKTASDFAHDKQVTMTDTEVVIRAKRALDREVAFYMGEFDTDISPELSSQMPMLKVNFLLDGVEVALVDLAIDVPVSLQVEREGEIFEGTHVVKLQDNDLLVIEGKKYRVRLPSNEVEEYDVKLTKLGSVA